MDLDLLKKLINLANNNPNDHEANSAARRVCKMIAEGNYDFMNTQTPPKQASGRTAWDVVNDYMNQRYSQAQQNSWSGYGAGYDPSYAQKEAYQKAQQQTERAREKFEEERKKAKEQERQARKSYEDRFRSGTWDWKGFDWESPYGKPKYPNLRLVPCLGGCGSIKQTSDNFWTCDDCAKRNKKDNRCIMCGCLIPDYVDRCVQCMRR